MKKITCFILVFTILFSGCAGREANPIPVYLPGDENRSCETLKSEVAQLQQDMARMLPKTDKFGTNALWFAGGCFLIVPFFFMDLKDAEKTEFEAMRQRHNRLLIIAKDKGCDMAGVRAETIPSLQEQKREAEKILKKEKKADANQKSLKQVK